MPYSTTELELTLVVQEILAEDEDTSETEMPDIPGETDIEVPKDPLQPVGEAPPASSEVSTIQFALAVSVPPATALTSKVLDAEADIVLLVNKTQSSAIWVDQPVDIMLSKLKLVEGLVILTQIIL